MHHHNASSYDVLSDEQPAWLDELLNEPISPKMMNKISHRRSTSDTAINLLPYKEDGHVHDPSWQFQNHNRFDHFLQPNIYGKPMLTTNIGTNHISYGGINRVGVSTSKSMVNKMKGITSKQDGSGSKTDSKRIKQQNAHRARLRKLEYITNLERTIQLLQVEGCEMSSAIYYLDQQLIMLTMENRALKQRMDSLSEIQKLKHMEQQFLEKELGDLQRRQQNQKQVQPIQHNGYNKYQPAATQELESQIAALVI